MKKKILKIVHSVGIAIICSVFFAFSANAQTTTVTVQYGSSTGNTGEFSASLPSGVANVNGVLWGAGGGGGTARADGYTGLFGNGWAMSAASGGSGGGSSTFSWGSISGVIAISIGQGGSPANGGSTVGCTGSYDACVGRIYVECVQSGTGGHTTVSRTGVTVTANGGVGGKSAAVDANGSACNLKYNSPFIAPGGAGNAGTGGTGGQGYTNIDFGIGGAGGMGHNGGQGASAKTNPNATGSVNGDNGNFPGGGGGGGAASSRSSSTNDGLGGNGAHGQVLLSFDYFNPSTPIVSPELPNVNCFTNNVVLTISNDETANNVVYQWYKDGAAISGAIGTSYTVTSQGVYKVSAMPLLGISSIPFSGAVAVTVQPTNAYASVSGTTLNFTENFSREITFAQQPTLNIGSPYQNMNGTYTLFATFGATIDISTGITVSNGILNFYAGDQVTALLSTTVTINDAVTEYFVQAVSSPVLGCELPKQKLLIKSPSNVSIWSPGYTDGASMSDNDKTNYNDARNWMGIVPTATSAAYIAARTADGVEIEHFPYLVEGGNTYLAQSIYITSGAEIGNPHLLDYTHAHVQFNLGLEDPVISQQMLSSSDINALLLSEYLDYDHLKLSATLGNLPITRNRWYMLTAPLQSIVSGDFAFGGVPYVFIRKFDANLVETGSAFRGNWTNTFASNIEPLRPAEGFAIWINPYQAGGLGYQETAIGLDETAMGVSGRTVGLSQINGILEFPYCNETFVLQFEERQRAHRTHQAMPGYVSKFYSFLGNLALQYRNESVTRNDPDRFVFEALSTYTITAGSESSIALIGNPYPSTIDFDLFYAANSGNIKNGYTLWTGSSFSSYLIEIGGFGNLDGTIDQYIAPGQSFLVELAGGVQTADLVFPTSITVQRTPAITSTLRSSDVPRGLLNIETSNASGRVRTAVVQHEEGSVTIDNHDMSKILPSFNTLPEVYTLKAQNSGAVQGVATNFVPENMEMLIPIGIATTAVGNLRFTLSGMDNFVGEVFFIDKQTQSKNDISGLSEFVYNSEYIPARNANNQVLASEDRFFIHILDSPLTVNSLGDADDLQVRVVRSESDLRFYANSNIRSISIYDMNGRLIAEKSDINSLDYTLQTYGQMFVAKVVTDLGVRHLKVLK